MTYKHSVMEQYILAGISPIGLFALNPKELMLNLMCICSFAMEWYLSNKAGEVGCISKDIIALMGTYTANKSKPFGTYMRLWTKSALVQLMACRLSSTMTLP